MPSVKDENIKELLAKIKTGEVSLDWGYQQVCDVVQSIRDPCEKNPHYRSLFVTWWSKYKKKAEAAKAIKGRPAKRKQPKTPVPPETSEEARAREKGQEPKPFSENEQPPAKKGPKKPVLNHIAAVPAPSPEPNDAEVHREVPSTLDQFDFAADLFNKEEPNIFEDTAEDKKPAAKPSKATPSRTTPKASKRSPEAIIMSEHMLPGEVALKLIAAAPVPPRTFSLNEGGSHGIEMYKVPHPCKSSGIMCVTYFVVGATSAELQPGGKQIHVTFPRKQSIGDITAAMKRVPAFSQRLTRGDVNDNFTQMSELLYHLLETKNYNSQVSIFGSSPVKNARSNYSSLSALVYWYH